MEFFRDTNIEFLKYRKKYWLAPILFLLILVGLLLVLAEKSVLAPFIAHTATNVGGYSAAVVARSIAARERG